VSKGVPSRTSAPTPALDQTYDIQIIPGKVRPLSRHLTEAHPQVLIIARQAHHLLHCQTEALRRSVESADRCTLSNG
jgi:hypothetical protein